MIGWNIDGDKLRELREEARITPTELATLAGCHPGTVRNAEGGSQMISAKLIWAILGILSDRLGRTVTVPDIATPRERYRRKTPRAAARETDAAGSAA